MGILILKKLKGRVRTSFCWPRESKLHPLAHRTVSKTRQSDRKNLPREEFGRPTYSDVLLKEAFRECPAKRDAKSTSASRARKGGLHPVETPIL